jgi:hypothetical protein
VTSQVCSGCEVSQQSVTSADTLLNLDDSQKAHAEARRFFPELPDQRETAEEGFNHLGCGIHNEMALPWRNEPFVNRNGGRDGSPNSLRILNRCGLL